MEDEAYDLVTVKIFDNPFSANLIKGRLEDSGIRAEIFDENIVGANPLYARVVGGIKLKVRSIDVDKANELLSDKNLFPLTKENGEVLICPKCGSDKIEPGVTAVRSVRSFFAAALGLIMSVLPLYLDRLYCCNNCGYCFKADKY